MAIVKTNDEVTHPEGKLLLLNGNIIQGYTPERIVTEHIEGNELMLDTTGQYLAVGNRKPKIKGKCASETGHFFYTHAFFFLAHADKILADSRMFLAPVPIQNGLAYTGSSGFRYPTLGVYLEWWLNNPVAVREENDEKALVWYIAGSPLSGSNRCSIVNQHGETKTVSLSPFLPVWSSFMRVNTRYDEAKQKYAAFTLEEVYTLLGGNEEDELDKSHSLIHDCFFLRSQSKAMAERLAQTEAEVKKLKAELTTTKIQLHESTMREIYEEYVIYKREQDKRTEELLAARAAFKKRLKAGELTNVEYQHAIRDISKELRDTPFHPYPESVSKAEEVGLTMWDLIDYYQKQEK